MLCDAEATVGHIPAPGGDALRRPDAPARWATCPGRAFGAYLALFALLAAPWLATATHGIPIHTPLAADDTRLLTWILWWVASSLTGDPRALLDAPINYPAEQQLTGSEHFAALQLVFLPAYALTGNAVLAINLILFLAYPLAAWAMSRLLLALGFAPLVAWVVGLAFALGAQQVPTHVHQLHALPLFLPALALALHRLRDDGGARAALLLAAVFLVACFTAYYTVALLVPLLAVWTLAEVLRRGERRGRFVATVGGVAGACLALLIAASAPYLARARTLETPEEVDASVRQIAALSSTYLDLATVHIFGAVSLVLAVVGLVGLLHARWRRTALLGCALAALSVFLVRGGALDVASSLPAALPTELLLVPVRFVRMVLRYAVLGGFGLALLGAVGLQLAAAALPRRAAVALLCAVACAIVAERGRVLWQQEIDTSAALTTDAHVYDRVAAITARAGRGPLLELPLSSFGHSQQPEAMMGSMRHGLPLVSGHTGYQPPHRRLLDATVQELPSDGALQDIVDMTHVRWILLRPARFWASGAEREAFARELASVPGVGPRWDLSGWTLLAVRRSPVRADWFDAVARGGVPDDGEGSHHLAFFPPARSAGGR